jgi:tRNA (guanine37-N1)-methyltransferase
VLQFDIFTLFPEMFAGPLTESMLKRAQENGIVSITLHNIRDYTTDKHHTADGTPYGGGGGMILKPEPVVAAVEAAIPSGEAIPVILLSPQGQVFTQKIAGELSQHPRLALICGHYEGIDERVRKLVITGELSIGDYVLTGGELAAMVVIDAITRLLPGALGDPTGPIDDSHATGLLEYPHYTRPPEFRGLEVPEILLSGHEAKVEAWRREQSIRRTWQRRPDLLLTADLTDADRETLFRLATEEIEKRGRRDQQELST